MTEFRVRAAGRKTFELRLGESVERRTGRIMHRFRRIDWRNDGYFEYVVDPRTGEIVHWDAEPLSEHRGRRRAAPSRLVDGPGEPRTP